MSEKTSPQMPPPIVSSAASAELIQPGNHAVSQVNRPPSAAPTNGPIVFMTTLSGDALAIPNLPRAAGKPPALLAGGAGHPIAAGAALVAACGARLWGGADRARAAPAGPPAPAKRMGALPTRGRGHTYASPGTGGRAARTATADGLGHTLSPPGFGTRRRGGCGGTVGGPPWA